MQSPFFIWILFGSKSPVLIRPGIQLATLQTQGTYINLWHWVVFNRIPATQYHSCHVWRTQYFISHIDVSRFLVDTMFSSWWPKHVSLFRNVTGNLISARAMWVCSMKISMWGYLPSCRYVGTTDPCHENFIRGDELTNCTCRISKFRNSEFQTCPWSLVVAYPCWSHENTLITNDNM